MLEDGPIRGEGEARLFMKVGWANYWSGGHKGCLQFNSFKKGQVIHVQLYEWRGQDRWGKGLKPGLLGVQRVII